VRQSVIQENEPIEIEPTFHTNDSSFVLQAANTGPAKDLKGTARIDLVRGTKALKG
jgi:hypothetical protein